MTKKWWLAILVTGLVLAGGVGWVQRTSILAWYYVHRLARADDAERDACIDRVLSLEKATLPGVLGCLRSADARSCANAQAALLRFLQKCGPNHPCRAVFASQLADVFPRLSGFGQQNVLELETALVVPSQGAPSPAIVSAAARLVTTAARVTDHDVRLRAIDLAAALLGQPQLTAEVLDAGRTIAGVGLQDDEAGNRQRAVRLATRPKLKLLEQVAPLLSDPDAGVRREAMLAIGQAREAVRDDELLRSLHDPDPDVRRLCEAALRSRGLREEQLRRGRLLTDARPTVRLQVLDGLCQAPDLEPGVWLRHLSHDPEPAVRAAAVRAAAEQNVVDLSDRIEQMARDDPSDTVRQMARHYLSCRKSSASALSRP